VREEELRICPNSACERLKKAECFVFIEKLLGNPPVVAKGLVKRGVLGAVIIG